MWLKHGGTLQGVQGKLGQFDDHGRWWVKDDKLCVQWELWLFAKPTCYGVELEGDQITRIEYGTGTIIRSTLVRDGKCDEVMTGVAGRACAEVNCHGRDYLARVVS